MGNKTVVQRRGEEMGRAAGTLCKLQRVSHLCSPLTVSFFNIDMNFSLFYETERAPDYYDARKLLENWVSSFLFLFSCISSKHQMMGTGGTECKLVGQHRNKYSCNNILAFQNHVIQRIFNRIKLNSEGREKCWHFAKMFSHFHQVLELGLDEVLINQVNKNVIVLFLV